MTFKFIKADDLDNQVELKDVLPYGMYITADGTEVLFDRHYEPMYARDAKGDNVQRASGFVENVVKQVWFYDDKHSLMNSSEARLRSEKALVSFVIGDAVNDYVINEKEAA
jgi:hypothetical protein